MSNFSRRIFHRYFSGLFRSHGNTISCRGPPLVQYKIVYPSMAKRKLSESSSEFTKFRCLEIEQVKQEDDGNRIMTTTTAADSGQIRVAKRKLSESSSEFTKFRCLEIEQVKQEDDGNRIMTTTTAADSGQIRVALNANLVSEAGVFADITDFSDPNVLAGDTKSGVTVVSEGKAKVEFPNSVFYNPVQEFNRDLTVAVISEFSKENATKKGYTLTAAGVKAEKGIRILEALGASGLRSVRFGLEVPGVSEIICNDFDDRAVEFIQHNVDSNNISNLVRSSKADAALLMYQCQSPASKFDVIDLDPYGSPSHFLDAAVQAIEDGGLLCVTATDMAVMSGNFGETAYTKYGSYSIRSKACHEIALRILLHSIESHAIRYSKYIEPILSVSVDFYIRVFVRIHESQARAKFSASKQGMIYQCIGCGSQAVQPLGYSTLQANGQYKHTPGTGPPVGRRCDHCGDKHQIAGPVWIGRIHEREFVTRLAETMHEHSLGTSRRMIGVLKMIHEELPDVVLYYIVEELCKTLHCLCINTIKFRSAIMNAGYEVSFSHAHKNTIKTTAPVAVIWDILRQWVKLNPVSQKRMRDDCAAKAILEVEPKLKVSFDIRDDANAESREQGLLRFQMNPQKDWGPKPRAKRDFKDESGLHNDTPRDEKKKKKHKRKQKLPCREVKNGMECSLGLECPYSHDLEYIKNFVPFTKKFPCKKYQLGNCDKGDDCRYNHSLSPVKVADNDANHHETMNDQTPSVVVGTGFI